MTGTPGRPTGEDAVRVDVGGLGPDAGAHVLVKLALADRAPGERVEVHGTHPDLLGGLAAWCRQRRGKYRP